MTYRTIAQSIRANGDRHMANGDRHLAEGHSDYAEGSWRKAKRNYDRANEMEEWLRPKNQSEAAMRDFMLRMLEHNIYQGP